MSRFQTYDSSDVATAGAAASETAAMTAGRQYVLRAVAAVWFRIVKPGEASAVAAKDTDGSHYLPAGAEVKVAAIGERTAVSVVRDGGSDTKVILSETPGVTSSA